VILLSAFSLANLGWASPNANQQFREMSYRVLYPSEPTNVPRGNAELTATDLIRGVQQDGSSRARAMAILGERTRLLVLVPVCLLIGTQARRLVRARRWSRGAGVVAWSVMIAGWLIASGVAGVASALLVQRQQLEAWYMFEPLRPLLVPVACGAGGILLAWCAHRTEVRTPGCRATT
jgi:hypothetical protein